MHSIITPEMKAVAAKEYRTELQKVMAAVNMGAEAIMALSSHSNTLPFPAPVS